LIIPKGLNSTADVLRIEEEEELVKELAVDEEFIDSESLDRGRDGEKDDDDALVETESDREIEGD
jgi:hypothetical protein